jgi:Family of unknown function (DUF5757)
MLILPFDISVESFFQDTEETLRNRIAWAVGTIPRYMSTEPRRALLGRDQVTVTKLPDLIASSNEDLRTFLQTHKGMYAPVDIIWLWYLQRPMDIEVFIFEVIADPTRHTDKPDPDMALYGDILYEIESRRSYKEEIDQAFHTFNFEQHAVRERMFAVQQVPKYPMTFVRSTDTVIQTSFTCEYESLASVFNQLNVSKQTPFITYNKYFKVLKHYVPPYDWQSSEDAILIKMVAPDNKYKEIRIRKVEEGDLDDLDLVDVTSLFQVEVSKEDMGIVPELLRNIKYTTTNQDELLSGSTFVVDMTIEWDVLCDILMTKPFLTQYVSVNDNVQRSVEMYCAMGKGAVRLSMTNQLATARNEVYAINTVFTQFKVIRATNSHIVTFMSELLPRIVYLCHTEGPSIHSFYAKYVEYGTTGPSGRTGTTVRTGTTESTGAVEEDDDEVKEVARPVPQAKVQKILFPKDLIPEIFVSKGDEIYTRKCQSVKQPIIISEEDALDEKNDVMLFPKPSDSHVSQPQYYTCNDAEYSHIGLIPFQNELGYAPCCFKTSQVNKKTYKQYFEGLEVEDAPRGKTGGGYLIRTNKVILDGNYGYFPRSDKIVNDVGLFFTQANTQPDTRVVMRYGVSRSPNSFLECVLRALSMDRDVAFARRELANSNVQVAMQEMYADDVQSIVDYLSDETLYLDPLKVIRLVEWVYRCNIVVFTKDKTSNGQLSVPHHTHGYCTYDRDLALPSIFVYCHYGAEMDLLEYPQCELIFQATPDVEDQIKRRHQGAVSMAWSHDMFDPIYRYTWRAYDVLTETYYGKYRSRSVPMSVLLDTLPIVGQYIDPYGKVRGLLLEGGIDIETTPIAPLPVPSVDTFVPRVLDKAFVLQFINAYSLTNPLEHTSEGRSQYVTALYQGCIQFTLYTGKYRHVASECDRFVRHSRIARYATNWMMYLFSEYCATYQVQEVTPEVLNRFVSSTCMVVRNVRYTLNRSSELFARDESGLVKKFDVNTLILSSKELLKRLVYQLQLLLERDRKKVLSFHERKTMDAYFTMASDYTSYPNENLFQYLPQGGMVELLRAHKYTLHQYPPDTSEPYFFSHPKVTEKQVALCQNMDTLSTAYGKLAFWETRGYNKMDPADGLVYEQYAYYMLAIQRSTGNVLAFAVNDAEPEVDRRVVYSDRGFAPVMLL